jgi:hypothetical protein
MQDPNLRPPACRAGAVAPTAGDDSHVTPANDGVLESAGSSGRHGFTIVFCGVCAVFVPRVVGGDARPMSSSSVAGWRQRAAPGTVVPVQKVRSSAAGEATQEYEPRAWSAPADDDHSASGPQERTSATGSRLLSTLRKCNRQRGTTTSSLPTRRSRHRVEIDPQRSPLCEAPLGIAVPTFTAHVGIDTTYARFAAFDDGEQYAPESGPRGAVDTQPKRRAAGSRRRPTPDPPVACQGVSARRRRHRGRARRRRRGS